MERKHPAERDIRRSIAKRSVESAISLAVLPAYQIAQHWSRKVLKDQREAAKQQYDKNTERMQI